MKGRINETVKKKKKKKKAKKAKQQNDFYGVTSKVFHSNSLSTFCDFFYCSNPFRTDFRNLETLHD